VKVAVEVVALPYYQHGKGKHKVMKPISLMVSYCWSYCSSVIRVFIYIKYFITTSFALLVFYSSSHTAHVIFMHYTLYYEITAQQNKYMTVAQH